jgi:hypothetical protein
MRRAVGARRDPLGDEPARPPDRSYPCLWRQFLRCEAQRLGPRKPARARLRFRVAPADVRGSQCGLTRESSRSGDRMGGRVQNGARSNMQWPETPCHVLGAARGHFVQMVCGSRNSPGRRCRPEIRTTCPRARGKTKWPAGDFSRHGDSVAQGVRRSPESWLQLLPQYDLWQDEQRSDTIKVKHFATPASC